MAFTCLTQHASNAYADLGSAHLQDIILPASDEVRSSGVSSPRSCMRMSWAATDSAECHRASDTCGVLYFSTRPRLGNILLLLLMALLQARVKLRPAGEQ